jgi:hypothetical protein
MHNHKWISLFVVFFLWVGTDIRAESVPLLIPHSGILSVGKKKFSGNGQFKFAIVNGHTDCQSIPTGEGCVAFWTNDNSKTNGSEPTNAVTLLVASGKFGVNLGETTLTNMVPLPTTAFTTPPTYLRIWFNDGITGFQRLAPDQQLVSVPYAYRAEEATKVTGGNVGVKSLNGLKGEVSLVAGDNIAIVPSGNQLTIEAKGGIGPTGPRGPVGVATAVSPLVLTGTTLSLPNVVMSGVNTAIGAAAFSSNTTGSQNTANGAGALRSNTTGSNNTAMGYLADLSAGHLENATAIGAHAHVNASNKIRLGDTHVTVIEGQVAFTAVSDKNQKENFWPVDGEEVLKKIRGMSLASWNYIGHDPKQFRHYGPVAQEFFAAFGNDSVGTIGTETTINSGDMAGILMIAIQALEKQNAQQAEQIQRLTIENMELKTGLDRISRIVGVDDRTSEGFRQVAKE